jgi:hypothetical protein
MDYPHAMMFSFLGMGPALAIFFLLRPKRRAWVPPLGWWLSLVLGSIFFFYGLAHSTAPSFAKRITAVGKVYDYTQREIYSGYHHDTIYGFRLVPENGAPIHIETEIILPDSALPDIFNGRTFRVVYLADSERVLENEAIDLVILTGRHAGYHDSLNARLAGSWLAIPLGAALGAFGFAGLKYMKSDEIAAASDDDETST